MNSEHHNKSKNARRSIEWTDGNKCLARIVWMQQIRVFCQGHGAAAPISSLIKKLMLPSYTWMADVLILRLFSNKMSVEW